MNNDNAWLVATTTPWTVAPHPNFRSTSLYPYQVLALVSLYRLHDVERFRAMLPEDTPSWAKDLIDLSLQSLQMETISSATPQLWKLSEDTSLPYPVRMTAALYGSVAQADMDRNNVTLEHLSKLVKEGEKKSSSDNSLALALGYQHLAARHFEEYDYEESLKCLISAHLHVEGMNNDIRFEVSSGISWTDREVVSDIKKYILKCILELRTRIEGATSSAWMDAVKSKATWIDYRNTSISLRRDSQYVAREYDASIGIHARGYTWSVERPVYSAALESLLATELSGDVNGYMRNRESLGQVLMLDVANNRENVKSFEYIRESLKLFRTARAEKSLKRALDHIHLYGPESALVSDAELILSMVSYPEGLLAEDIRVLGAAANYLKEDEVNLALEGCMAYAAAPKGDPGRIRLDLRTCWEAIGKLVEASSQDQAVAVQLLSSVTTFGDTDPALERSFRTVLSRLDLDLLDADVIDGLRLWGSGQEKSAQVGSFANLASVLGEDVNQSADGLEGQDLLIFLVNSTSFDRTESQLVNADEVCLNLLHQEISEAEEGVLTDRGADSGGLAAAYAIKFRRPQVWNKLSSLLLDGRVVREKKVHALERIAEADASVIPSQTRDILIDSWDKVLKSNNFDFFSEEPVDVPFVVAYRVGVQLGVIENTEALRYVTKFFGHVDEDVRRVTADLIYDFGRVSGSWEYAQLLLLQLLQDSNTTVRANAAKNLARSSHVAVKLGPLVFDALSATLKSAGIRVPIYTMYGFQRVVQEFGAKVLSAPYHNLIAQVAEEHPARVVRQAAMLVFGKESEVDF